MLDIMAAIGAVTQGIGIAKTLTDVDKTYDAASYKMQISDLIGALTDGKLALSEAREALADKDREIERLKAAFETKAGLVKGDGGYSYFVDDANNHLGFPICPKCELKDGRIVQLKQNVGHNAAKCPACDTTFKPVTNYLPNGLTAAEKRAKDIEGMRNASNNASRRSSWMSR